MSLQYSRIGVHFVGIPWSDIDDGADCSLHYGQVMVVWRARYLHTLAQSLTQASQMNTLQLFNFYQTTPKHYIGDGGKEQDNRLQQSPGVKNWVSHTATKS